MVGFLSAVAAVLGFFVGILLFVLVVLYPAIDLTGLEQYHGAGAKPLIWFTSAVTITIGIVCASVARRYARRYLGRLLAPRIL